MTRQDGPEYFDFIDDKIKKSTHAWRVLHIAMNKKIKVRHELRHIAEHADKAAFSIAEGGWEGCNGGTGLHGQNDACEAFAGSRNSRRRADCPQPPRCLMVRDRAFEFHHTVVRHVLGTFRLTVPFYV